MPLRRAGNYILALLGVTTIEKEVERWTNNRDDLESSI
jgi:hypothetical protein